MERSAKLCVLALAAVGATLFMAFLVARFADADAGSAKFRPTDDDGDGKDDSASDDNRDAKRLLHAAGGRQVWTLEDVLRDGGGFERESREAFTGGQTLTSGGNREADCSEDKSFPTLCVDVSPVAYKLYRSVQAVGSLTIGDRLCSGVLLGDKTHAFFLTAATCLYLDFRVDQAAIEFTNCLGSRAFTPSGVYFVNRSLGFAILQLDTQGVNMGANYGFQRLRASTAVVDEPIFLPHFSDLHAQRISILDDSDVVIRVQPAAAVESCPTANPASRVSYVASHMDAATIGAPVVSLTDYLVVGVHACGGGCAAGDANSAVTSQAIVDDLRAHGALLDAFVAAP